MLVDLRNVSLEILGLVGAIETELLPRWRRGARCRVSFDHRDWPPDLPTAVSLQIYRVLQEALANVRKHAAAGQVHIVLERRSRRLFLTIADDGVGFDPALEAARTDGSLRVGLEGMRERAGLLDAHFDVRGAPGRRHCSHAVDALPFAARPILRRSSALSTIGPLSRTTKARRRRVQWAGRRRQREAP